MGDLDIEIKVAVGDAVAEINRVTSATRKTETAAKDVNHTFADLARLVQQGSKTQVDMLARIHGPAEQAIRDFTALEALMRKGQITSAQYATELERIGRAAGHVSKGVGANPADAVSLQMPKAGGLSGLMESGAAKLAAGGAITLAASEMLKLDNATVHAENSLRKFTDSNTQLKSLLAQTTDVSYALHISMEEGAKIFGEVGDATKGLYLTTKQQVDIMKGLGEIAQNDGGDIGEMMGMMKQLTFAMDAGTISGRELKGMMKQSDDVAQLWVDRLGMSRTELIAQANAGKIGTAQLREMFMALGTSAETTKKHEERSHSLTETLSQMKDRALEPLSVWLGRYIADLEATWEPLNQTIELNKRLYATLSDALDKMTSTTQLAAVASSFIGISDVIKRATRDIKDYDDVAKLTGMDIRTGYHDAVDKLNRALDQGQISQSQFTEGMKAAAKAAGMVADNVHKATKEVESMSLADLRAAISNARPIDHLRDGEHWMTADSLKAPNYETGSAEWLKMRVESEEAGKTMEKLAEDSVEAIDKANKKLVEDWSKNRQAQIDAVADHLKPLEDALVELALTGETSWRKMADAMIADLARVATQKAIMGLINLAFTGSTSSPAEQAAGALAGGSHAFGGSYITPGVGGQDSVPVMFRLTPGERVDFTPPGGYGSGGGGNQRSSAPAPARPIIIEDRRDPRALMQGGPDVDRVILDSLHRHGFRRN